MAPKMPAPLKAAAAAADDEATHPRRTQPETATDGNGSNVLCEVMRANNKPSDISSRPRRRWVLALLAVLLVVAASGCYYTPEQQQVLSQINQSRAQAGRPPVSMNYQMAANAQRWAEHLAATGRLEHTTTLRQETPAGSWWGAENAGGPSTTGTTSIHERFMGSSGHRNNILSSSANIAGTGVARDRYGNWWVVHRFAGCCR